MKEDITKDVIDAIEKSPTIRNISQYLEQKRTEDKLAEELSNKRMEIMAEELSRYEASPKVIMLIAIIIPLIFIILIGGFLIIKIKV